MAKDKKTIKYEADISGFKKNIETANNNIKTLNNTLKLNQAQLKGNKESVQLLSEKVGLLKEKYDEQGKVVENTRAQYEKAVEVYGENSKQAENLKNKLIQAETKQQSIANAIKETNEQLAVQSSKLISAGSSMNEFGDRTSKVGDKIDKVGNKLSVLSAGVTAVAVASLKASISFESAWTGVTKTVDGTEEQLNDLRQGILDLSTQIPSTAEEIAGVAENAGQLGIATDNVLSFTKVMIDLGNSTNLSADEASSALAKFANVTKMSASDYDKLGSTIVALGNNFATTEADIVEMATRLASTGELAGLSQSQILALATSMSSVGIEAEAGGSAMSKLLKQIQVAVETGSSDLKDFAKVAGVSTEEFKKAFEKDAVGALSSFISGLNDTERNGKSAISILDDMGITEVRLSNTILSLANASDVMTSAVELSEKAWKENTALTDEANKRYETTESKLQMLKNEIVKNGIALGDELKPALVDVLEEVKSIITDVTSLVKKFNKLDDATKKQIINAGKMVAVLGPAVKIGGKLISTLGNGIKTVGSFSQAIGLVGKTSTEAFKNTSSGTQTLAKALTFIKSPAGIATVAITSLAGALVYLALKETEAQKEAKEFADEMSIQKQTLEDYNKSIDETTTLNLAQIDSVDKLKDELLTLVDENGKVKKGYESRVSFILNELNKALDTEYSLNGNVIESYQKLRDEIDKTIKKKKAEIFLNAEEEKYSNAIQNQADAVESLKTAHENLGMSIDEAKQKYQNYTDAVDEAVRNADTEAQASLILQSKEMQALKDKIDAYEDAEYQVKEYTNEVEKYQEDYALFVEEKYEEIGNTITDTTSNWTDSSLKDIQNAISQEKESLDKYKQIYKDTGNEIALQQQQQAQQNLQNLANELIARTSTIGTLGADEISAWKTLADSSYEQYKNAITQMAPEMQTQIQQATGVIVQETPYGAQVTENFANTIVEKLDKDSEFRTQAVNSLNSYIAGLSDEEKREVLKQAGVQDVEKVMEGLKEGEALSENQGVEILKSLNTGLKNSGVLTSLYNSANGIVSKLTSMFSIKTSVSTSSLPGHKDGLDYVPYDNYVARLHKGERVLTAQENKEYMNGNINNKLATNNITLQFFPQSMSDAEMERAFQYVDRKYGTKL